MKDFNGNTTLAGTQDLNSNTEAFEPNKSAPLLLPAPENLSPPVVDEHVDPAQESMPVPVPQSEPEQTPTEPQSTPKPLLTRADAGVDIVPETTQREEIMPPPASRIVPKPAGPERASTSGHSMNQADVPAEATLPEIAPAPQQDSETLAAMLAPKIMDRQAKVMVSMAGETADLFHTPRGDAYITIHCDGIDKTQKVNSKETIFWMISLVCRTTETIPSPSSLKAAIRTLEGKAIIEGPEIDVHLRYAAHDGCIYTDLCNDRREQIKITPNGHSIIQAKDSPVKFHREVGMAALCYPAAKGSFNPLLELLNLEGEADGLLLIGWLIGAMNPKGPFPILVLFGEQGSSKSTTTRLLKSLTDPSVFDLMSIPGSERDLAIAASKTWMIPFDNASKISVDQSDSFCRLSTGGYFRIRKPYTDTEETILFLFNPVVMNGIDDFIERQDLADRCIFINLPSISKHKRLPEKEFWRRWKEAKPTVLAALCEALSASLRNIDNVNLPEYPRMADFLQFVTAAESALPWKKGKFYEAYKENIKQVIDDALESDDVATTVMSMMERQKLTKWEGTATDLKAILDTIVDDRISRSKEWPKRPNMLSRRLQRCASFLRTKGIQFDKGKSGDRYISLRKYAEDTLNAGLAPKQQAAMATTVGEEEYEL